MVEGFPGQVVVVQKARVKPTARPIPKMQLVNRWPVNMEDFLGQVGAHQLMNAKQNVNQIPKIQSVKSMPVNFKDQEVAIQWNHVNLIVNRIPLIRIVKNMLASLDLKGLVGVTQGNLVKVIAGKITRIQIVLLMWEIIGSKTNNNNYLPQLRQDLLY